MDTTVGEKLADYIHDGLEEMPLYSIKIFT